MEQEKLVLRLRTHLSWHKTRLTLAASAIIAVTKLRTVTLSNLALLTNPAAKTNSDYRRLQRFLTAFDFDQLQIARLVLALLPKQESLIVTLDRTHWRLGKIDLNVFMTGVAYRGTAFPLVWKLLGKVGNPKHAERKALP